MATSEPPIDAPAGSCPDAAAVVGEHAVPHPRRSREDEDRPWWDGPAHAARENGDHERARVLDEELFARRRRLLGDDHVDTLAAATGLAIDLTRLGRNARARALSEQTLARQRRVLGDDHPDTLVSAVTLAITLRRLGAVTRARRIVRWVADRDHSRGPGQVRAGGSTPA